MPATKRYRTCCLVSGGKDSVLSIMLAAKHGHEISCLANLFPGKLSLEEDMDSHMFQTVGHGLIERYNELISREIKIFRRRIRKGSKVLEMNYPEYKDRDKASEDEVECLRALLSFVKEKMPEVDAVCSGAILSDYQRLRVERVC